MAPKSSESLGSLFLSHSSPDWKESGSTSKVTEVTRLLEFLCQKPKQWHDEAKPSVINSDKELSHREVNQTLKKNDVSCECARGSKCGRKFCSFGSRVNESIHVKKEQASLFFFFFFLPRKDSIGSWSTAKQVVNKCQQWLLCVRQGLNVTGRLQPGPCTGTILQIPTG